MTSQERPSGGDWDLVIIHTIHPDIDYSWIGDCKLVLDATYQFDVIPDRYVP
jgi:hypothetical protein